MRKPPIWNDAVETRELDAQEAQHEARAQHWANRDRFGHHTPFYIRCPLNAIEDVARGLRPATPVRFLLARHVVVVGGDEWVLDGDLDLWRKAKAYARRLNHQGLLNEVQRQGELIFEKRETARHTL